MNEELLNKIKAIIKTILLIIKKTLHISLITVFILLLIPIILILLLKWYNPPTTSFMIQKKIELWNDKKNYELKHQWVSYDKISNYMKLAVIASEDQNYPNHFGLDVVAIGKAISHNEKHQQTRGASTITQQVAKNLFLWSDRNYLRKGLEAYMAVLMEKILDKERILEIYLNIAEMGPKIYGVQSAAKIYYNRKPDQLTIYQAATLASVLPNPIRLSPVKPNRYVLIKRNWIIQQMNSLGGFKYLEELKKRKQ